jgi:predicted HTH transcriptional regulator
MQESGIPTTRADLQSLIDSRIEENWSLEYKAAGALNRENPRLRDEMTKDISAFANAAGGTLIYGIKEFNEAEKRHLPSVITPINAMEYSREWLDQMVGQIQPRIDGLRINPLHVGPSDSDFCYVVVVPPGDN